MKSFELKNELKEKIIAVAYGDARILDKICVYHLARKHNNIKLELEAYKQTAQFVRSLEAECPDELLSNLKLNKYPVPKTKNSIIADFLSIIINKPAASAAIMVILFITVTLSIILNSPFQKRYTETEIMQANEQARYALGLIGSIMNETKEKLEKEVIKEYVVKPISGGIEIVNRLLIKGEPK
jgi:hypothetical protein